MTTPQTTQVDQVTEFPMLYETQEQKDPKALVKFFDPRTKRTWYVLEYDPATQIFYGFTRFKGKTEWGYFNLGNLEKPGSPKGKQILRDPTFQPMPISKIIRR